MNDLVAVWYYVDKTSQHAGPISESGLYRLLDEKVISRDTLIWKEGMNAWKPWSEVFTKAPVPPRIEATRMEPVAHLPDANRFPRFFARTFDIALIGLIVMSLVVVFLLEEALLTQPLWITAVMFFMVMPVSLFLEAIIFSIAGNTPGKAILGIKVVTLQFERPSFLGYLWRNFRLYVTGYAFGLWILSFFTWIWQAIRIGNGKQATYDTKTRVLQKPRSGFRTFVFIVLYLTVPQIMLEFLENRIVDQFDQSRDIHLMDHRVRAFIRGMKSKLEESRMDRPSLQVAPPAPQTVRPTQGANEGPTKWTNSVTGHSCPLGEAWSVNKDTSDPRLFRVQFTERKQRAAIDLSLEIPRATDLPNYVGLYKNSMQGFVFKDNGRFVDLKTQRGGHSITIWESSGYFEGFPKVQYDIQIGKVGQQYWRVISSFNKETPGVEPPLKALRESIFTTF